MLILWDLSTNKSLRVVPTYECIESLVPVRLGYSLPQLNVTDVKNPHVLTAGERGVVRVWNMKTATEVFTQKDSLVSPPGVEGAPTITQLVYNSTNDLLYVVTFDHNIMVHRMCDLSLIKQVLH